MLQIVQTILVYNHRVFIHISSLDVIYSQNSPNPSAPCVEIDGISRHRLEPFKAYFLYE